MLTKTTNPVDTLKTYEKQKSLVSSVISTKLKSSVEMAMILCALASTLSGLFMDPIIKITRNTFF